MVPNFAECIELLPPQTPHAGTGGGIGKGSDVQFILTVLSQQTCVSRLPPLPLPLFGDERMN